MAQLFEDHVKLTGMRADTSMDENLSTSHKVAGAELVLWRGMHLLCISIELEELT